MRRYRPLALSVRARSANTSTNDQSFRSDRLDRIRQTSRREPAALFLVLLRVGATTTADSPTRLPNAGPDIKADHIDPGPRLGGAPVRLPRPGRPGPGGPRVVRLVSVALGQFAAARVEWLASTSPAQTAPSLSRWPHPGQHHPQGGPTGPSEYLPTAGQPTVAGTDGNDSQPPAVPQRRGSDCALPHPQNRLSDELDHFSGSGQYLRHGLSYCDVEELLAERGIAVDHLTVYRWVQSLTPGLIDAARPARHAAGDRCSCTRPTYRSLAAGPTCRWRSISTVR